MKLAVLCSLNMELDLRLETEVAFTDPSVGASHINNNKAPAALNLKNELEEEPETA